MTLEYAPRGLLGVLTPQANTTVEPEFWMMLPPGMALINARMTSDKPTLEARLTDYFDHIDDAVRQFHNAPVAAIAFATTGASYLAGPDQERLTVEAVSERTGVPFVTAGLAVVSALRTLGARHIGLVSPYPEALTRKSIDYWLQHDFKVEEVAQIAPKLDQFHPIYSILASDAGEALAELVTKPLDAILMLGTGMPTLRLIADRSQSIGPPVVSCMTCLAWASIDAALGRTPDRQTLMNFMQGEPWKPRVRAALQLPDG